MVCGAFGYTVYKKNDIKEEKMQYEVYNLEDTDDIKSYTLEDIKYINNGVNPDVSYNDNGFIKSINSKYTDLIINNDKDAIQSMYNVKNLFGFLDPAEEFSLKKIDENQDQIVYRFQQIYEGYMVYSNEVIIVVDKEGNAVSIIGKYTPITDIDFSDIIDKKEAVSKVSESLKKGTKYEVEKVVYANTKDDSYVAAWMIKCTNKDYITEDKIVFVNAKNGEIISEVPLTIN